MLINHNYKFIFVHIQKTAGTSITSVLNEIPGTEPLYYSHSQINVLKEEYEDYFKFCFVRNPWDRLYSWWNMIVNKGKHNDTRNLPSL